MKEVLGAAVHVLVVGVPALGGSRVVVWLGAGGRVAMGWSRQQATGRHRACPLLPMRTLATLLPGCSTLQNLGAYGAAVAAAEALRWLAAGAPQGERCFGLGGDGAAAAGSASYFGNLRAESQIRQGSLREAAAQAGFPWAGAPRRPRQFLLLKKTTLQACAAKTASCTQQMRFLLCAQRWRTSSRR
jgi:hypothetical protein